jgi:hypothetical protein
MDKNDLPSSGATRQYRYGEHPTWEIVLNAVLKFGRPVSQVEIRASILADIPNFKRSNLGPDLCVLSVNCASRGHYSMNTTPRRTDSGNHYDRLIKIGGGQTALYTAYDPDVHGVWELADCGHTVLQPRFVKTAASAELEHVREAAEANGILALGDDVRTRIMAGIVLREGQAAFRNALLAAYGRACAISGCTVQAVLEAAHIVPYGGGHTNIVTNGLLLRADLHTLFDLHLLSIEPATRTVRLSHDLRNSEYACIEGVRLRAPVKADMAPLPEALSDHWERCGWLHAGPQGLALDAETKIDDGPATA